MPNYFFTAKLTYKFYITFDLDILRMQTAPCLLDDNASVNLLIPSMILPSSERHTNSDSMQKLESKTRQPLNSYEQFHLKPRIGAICNHIALDTTPHLTVNIQLHTLFIGRFMNKIFSTEFKVSPSHSKPVAILTRTSAERRLTYKTSSTLIRTMNRTMIQGINDAIAPHAKSYSS